jgi:hypothetical protein
MQAREIPPMQALAAPRRFVEALPESVAFATRGREPSLRFGQTQQRALRRRHGCEQRGNFGGAFVCEQQVSECEARVVRMAVDLECLAQARFGTFRAAQPLVHVGERGQHPHALRCREIAGVFEERGKQPLRLLQRARHAQYLGETGRAQRGFAPREQRAAVRVHQVEAALGLADRRSHEKRLGVVRMRREHALDQHQGLFILMSVLPDVGHAEGQVRRHIRRCEPWREQCLGASEVARLCRPAPELQVDVDECLNRQRIRRRLSGGALELGQDLLFGGT